MKIYVSTGSREILKKQPQQEKAASKSSSWGVSGGESKRGRIDRVDIGRKGGVGLYRIIYRKKKLRERRRIR